MRVPAIHSLTLGAAGAGEPQQHPHKKAPVRTGAWPWLNRYWQASQASPLRIASMLQAVFSAAV